VTMAKFRKKPVVIEAWPFWKDGDYNDVAPVEFVAAIRYDTEDRPYVRTREGPLAVSNGDWIIRGVKGEFYPCKPDIFAEIYEPATDPAAAPTEDEGMDQIEAALVGLGLNGRKLSVNEALEIVRGVRARFRGSAPYFDPKMRDFVALLDECLELASTCAKTRGTDPYPTLLAEARSRVLAWAASSPPRAADPDGKEGA